MNRKKSLILSIGISVALILTGGWFLYGHNMMNWENGALCTYTQHGQMGGGMGIFMILFWLFVIGIFAMILAGATKEGGNPKSRDTATEPADILKRRYASGELDEDEYRQKLQNLKE